MVQVTELQKKCLAMEQSLTHVVREFEKERDVLVRVTKHQLDEVKRVAETLRTHLHRKSIEMKHVKVSGSGGALFNS